ncbi:hypothetical protein FGO68_gene15936 [Halteria grandinella]|uniref:Uncharacterized protein n=1 Tax=Halteria grandinella TaxID=5974 RepID=A0A8J8NZN6_HALGN|nr:hypothetical protein FGO68_gene15936 [Halteria grandinella]
MKMIIQRCDDIPKFFQDLPASVTQLSLNYREGVIQNDTENLRKFRKLNLYGCKETLKIFSNYATATESLTIDQQNIEEQGIIMHLIQMDCKKIIVRANNLKHNQLIEFFKYKSKSIKFIECDSILSSQIEEVQWAFQYFTQKQQDKFFMIQLDSKIDDADLFFEQLFNRSLKLFKNKKIY